MAVLGLAGITPALDLILADRIAKQFRTDSIFLNVIRHRAARNSALTWAVKFDTRTAGGAYAAGAAFSASEIDSHARVQATLGWANYRHALEVADETLDIVAATGGAEGVDLIGSEAMDVADKLSTTLGAHCFSGGGPGASPSPELAGAAIAIDASDDDFANVNTGTYTDWASSELTDSLSNLSKDLLRTKVLRPIKDATGRPPDILFTTGAIMDRIANVFDGDSDDMSEVYLRSAGGMVSLQKIGGARAYSLDGVPIVEDRHCTSGTVYGVSTDQVELRFVPPAPFVQTPAEMARLVQQVAGLDRIPEVSDIAARMSRLQQTFRPVLVHGGKLGTSERIFLRSGNVQLQWSRRDAFSKLTLS